MKPDLSLNKAIDQIRIIGGKETDGWCQDYFGQVQKIKGANRVFIRIASAIDKEQIEDYLVEIRFALIFIALKYDVEFEPFGEKGPDLKIERDNRCIVLEITRFRKIYPCPPPLDVSESCNEYGNSPRDIKKSIEKITEKFRQVANHNSIIAIWNDDGELENKEVETAVLNICTDVSNNIRSIPNGLLFVLYGSQSVIRNEQLYCFPFCTLDEPYRNWKEELQKYFVPSLVQEGLRSL